MILDYTYFQGTGLINIPNISLTNASGEAKRKELNSYIRVFEKELLIKLLGDDLYEVFIANITDSRFIVLKAELYNTTDKLSPVANYVAVKLWQKNQRTSTESGDKITSGDGLTPDANISHIMILWNDMVNELMEFQDWFTENLSTYPEYNGGYLFSTSDYMNSLGI